MDADNNPGGTRIWDCTGPSLALVEAVARFFFSLFLHGAGAGVCASELTNAPSEELG